MLKKTSVSVYRSLLLLALVAAVAPPGTAQKKASDDVWDDGGRAGYSEYVIRRFAALTVMPEYPDEAVARGAAGVVQAKVAIGDDNEVAVVRIHPRVDAALKKAVTDAVKQWKFKMSEGVRGSSYTLSRLTFRFTIVDGKGRVEMFDPGPAPSDDDRLDRWYSLKEWQECEETYRREKSAPAKP
jgi:outer membrane biosynthesis protein TonB